MWKTIGKAIGIILIVLLGGPAIIGALGTVVGLLMVAWPIVLIALVVLVPGVIIGVAVANKKK